MGRYNQAEEHLKKALLLAYNDMPQIFIKINLAAVAILKNDYKNGLSILKKMENQICEFIIDRPRQMYFVNMAFFSYACGCNNIEIEKYCEKAIQHPDRLLPALTTNRINIIKTFIHKKIPYSSSMFFNLFVPCYLAYWYQNPLELIPNKLLSQETINED